MGNRNHWRVCEDCDEEGRGENSKDRLSIYESRIIRIRTRRKEKEIGLVPYRKRERCWRRSRCTHVRRQRISTSNPAKPYIQGWASARTSSDGGSSARSTGSSPLRSSSPPSSLSSPFSIPPSTISSRAIPLSSSSSFFSPSSVSFSCFFPFSSNLKFLTTGIIPFKTIQLRKGCGNFITTWPDLIMSVKFVAVLIPLLKYQQKHPHNYIFLGLFTVSISSTVGVTCANTDGSYFFFFLISTFFESGKWKGLKWLIWHECVLIMQGKLCLRRWFWLLLWFPLSRDMLFGPPRRARILASLARYCSPLCLLFSSPAWCRYLVFSSY